jgi:hypothetical protein
MLDEMRGFGFAHDFLSGYSASLYATHGRSKFGTAFHHASVRLPARVAARAGEA